MLAELASTAGFVNARGAESCAARGGLDVFASAVRAGPRAAMDRGSPDSARGSRLGPDTYPARCDGHASRQIIFRDVIRATLSTDLATLESLELRHAQMQYGFPGRSTQGLQLTSYLQHASATPYPSPTLAAASSEQSARSPARPAANLAAHCALPS